MPSSLTRLPILLERYTWKIQAPEDVSIEIKSPNLKLKQHIPDQNQKCTGSYSYAVNSTTPGKAVNVGLFCPGGAIEKIQMKGNLTVTLTTYGKRWFNESQKQDLQLLFIPIMPGEFICSFDSLHSQNKVSFIFYITLVVDVWVKILPAKLILYTVMCNTSFLMCYN